MLNNGMFFLGRPTSKVEISTRDRDLFCGERNIYKAHVQSVKLKCEIKV